MKTNKLFTLRLKKSPLKKVTFLKKVGVSEKRPEQSITKIDNGKLQVHLSGGLCKEHKMKISVKLVVCKDRQTRGS